MCVLMVVWLAAPRSDVGAATVPPGAILTSNVVIVGAKGGALTTAVQLIAARRCTFASSPPLAQLPMTVACAQSSIRRVLQIPENETNSTRLFVVSVVVVGPGGSAVVRETVLQRARGATPQSDSLRAGQWWKPPLRAEWQWELDHPLKLSNVHDLGMGDVTAANSAARTPIIFDIDGITNPASTVAALHDLGDHVICYLEVGAAGNYYGSDFGATSYYATLQAAGDLGSKMAGYPERYLNITAPTTVTIVESMIKNECAAKGFDAVEPDIDDSYSDATGFSVSESADEAYDITLANYAHALGLGWGLKNGDGTDGFAAALRPYVDFALDEQCFQYQTCSAFAPSFRAAGKPVFEVEYAGAGGPALSSFCPKADADDFNAVLFDTNLDGKVRVPCR